MCFEIDYLLKNAKEAMARNSEGKTFHKTVT